jgi:hypothetical protein
LLVSSTALYDESTGSVDLEGAYIIFSGLHDSQALNVLVGKMATVFGTFAGRSFATVNPLVGTPLIYHYFTTAHGARVAANNQVQLSLRGYAERSGSGAVADL